MLLGTRMEKISTSEIPSVTNGRNNTYSFCYWDWKTFGKKNVLEKDVVAAACLKG